METKQKLKQCVALATAFLLCAQVNAQVVINEYCSSSTSFLDEDGDNFDWVELYNTTDANVNLEGWSLSDDADNLAKWIFPSVNMPAKSFLQIFTSSKDRKVIAAGKFLHTNFNISADGETVYLVNASGAIVHQTDSIVVPNDASRGLSPDGTGNWVFFAEPTPGAANTTKAYATSQTSIVTISPRGGVMQSAVTVTLSSEGNTPIYYTTDCTIPNPNNPDNSAKLYTEPIQIDSTTVIRAITSNADLMQGQPTTQTYIFANSLWWLNRDNQGNPITEKLNWVPDEGGNGGWNIGGWGNGWNFGDMEIGGHNDTVKVDPNRHTATAHKSTFDLPVFSLTTEPDNLWDYNEGIYVMGPNVQTYEPEPYYGANFHEDWERPVHVELYWTDGKQYLDQDAGVKIAGAYSRKNAQKSMSFHARKSYGEKYFNAKLFDELDLTKFKAFTLRDSGNDFENTHFRDAMITHLIAGNNVDIQAYQPAMVFLNGEFWGMLNIREKLNEDYIESHYPHVKANKVNILENNAEVNEGYNDDYLALNSYIKSNDLSNDKCYDYVASQIDIDEYIEYMVAQMYCNNDDWPHNNMKFWRSQNDGARWRWFLYDTDRGFSIWSDNSGNNMLSYCLATTNQTSNQQWPNFLLRNLVKNKNFKNELINRFADRMNCEYLESNINKLIDSLNNNIQSEIIYHGERWNISEDNRQGKIADMKKFAKNRPARMRSHIRSQSGFNAGSDVTVTIDVNDAKSGYIQLNSLTLKSFPWSGVYFANIPISIRAVARPGYKFVRWEDANGNTVDTHEGIQSVGKNPQNYKAIFEAEMLDYNSVVINEINCKSSDEQDTKDWIELYNTTASTIDISNWIISDEDSDNAFKMPAGTKIDPYGYLVVCENQKKLFKFWPELTNFVGDFEFGLGKADVIRLYDSEGALIDEVEYDSKENWPDANGNGYTMALIDPFDDNSLFASWTEDELYGTPGAQNGLFRPSKSDLSLSKEVYDDVEGEAAASLAAMCYPNPFMSDAAIVWEQAEGANVVAELYTAQGNMLDKVCDGWYPEGKHQIDITHMTVNWASGLYFAKVTVEGSEPVLIKLIKQ